MSELPVLFEDVRIVAAVPIEPGLPAKLCVTLDATHGFQVSSPKQRPTQQMHAQQDYQLQLCPENSLTLYRACISR